MSTMMHWVCLRFLRCGGGIMRLSIWCKVSHVVAIGLARDFWDIIVINRSVK